MTQLSDGPLYCHRDVTIKLLKPLKLTNINKYHIVGNLIFLFYILGQSYRFCCTIFLANMYVYIFIYFYIIILLLLCTQSNVFDIPVRLQHETYEHRWRLYRFVLPVLVIIRVGRSAPTFETFQTHPYDSVKLKWLPNISVSQQGTFISNHVL